jgi:hypothetical protein
MLMGTAKRGAAGEPIGGDALGCKEDKGPPEQRSV